MRGRNKISAKLRRKQKNVIDLQSIKLREKLGSKNEGGNAATSAPSDEKTELEKRREEFGALQRFAKKK